MSHVMPTRNSDGRFPTFGKWVTKWCLPRVDWRQRIAQSGLPDDVQQLLIQLVRKSRLLPFEKVEVADEMIDHFWSGLANGKSYIELIALFGDLKTAASLIRKSKIRNRPIMFKLMQLFGCGLVVLASSYLAIWAYYHSGHPSPTIDYTEQFNQFTANVEDDDAAWPIYRPLFTKFQFSEGGNWGSRMKSFYVENGTDEFGNPDRRRVTPEDPQWKTVKEKLDHWQPLLDAFRQGAQKPRLGLALQSDVSKYSTEDYVALFPVGHVPNRDVRMAGSIVGIALPHVQYFRTAARLLHFDTLYAIEQGDGERATENLATYYGLAQHAADCNCLVGAYVGFAIASMGYEELQDFLEFHPHFLSEDQLAEIQDSIENVNIRDWVRLGGERAMVYDIVQRVFTDNGSGDGRITPDGFEFLNVAWGLKQQRWAQAYPEFEMALEVAQSLSEPVTLFTNATRKSILERYDTTMDLIAEDLDRPAWEAKNYDLESLSSAPAHRRGLPGFDAIDLLPATAHLQQQVYLAVAEQSAAVLALAIHRYQLEQQQWPDDLQQLDALFAETPKDLCNGKPLRFSTQNDRVVVYSVGLDGDDDLGTLATYQTPMDNGQYSPPEPHNFHDQANKKISGWKYDGDLVLWPRRKN